MARHLDNITYGTRDRLGLFGQRESRINAQWLTLLGKRYERVKTDAGNVRGYDQNTNGMGMMVNNQNNDAAAFNAQDRERTDNNWGLTGLPPLHAGCQQRPRIRHRAQGALAQPLRALYLVDGGRYEQLGR